MFLAFSALEKELLTQLQESKNKISILEERLSLCRDQNDQLLSMYVLLCDSCVLCFISC